MPPLTVPAFMPNAPAAHVAMRHGVHGPGAHLLGGLCVVGGGHGRGRSAVRRGDVDVAIAGGAEALIVPGVVSAWQALQTLASFHAGEAARACKPFAANRSGFVLGEGAAFLVLESSGRAKRRGARVYAELAGSAISCDATHLTKPDAPASSAPCARRCRDAGLTPHAVGYCNAHGTATHIGDVVECDALRAVWGTAIDGLRVSSTKALHGHLLGAAGALEAVITMLALRRQQLPPNAHCETPDPQCAVHLVLQTQQAANGIDAAISNSFAFGGTNAVLVFKRA